MAYQDAWIRGATVSRGERSCSDRYSVIRSVIAPYTRPVTVWDLGANQGYFGCRLADEFGAVSIMVESRPLLADICRENALPTTIAMTHRLTLEDLQQLARCVHADVILALNVLHHMPDPVEAYRCVTSMGRDIVIETPGRADVHSVKYAASQELLDAIEADGPTQLAEFPSHVTAGVKRPLLHLVRDTTALRHGYVYVERVRPRGAHPARPHRIVCNHQQKTITYASGDTRDWHQGVNLWNWLQLGGSYPSRSTVAQAVRDVWARLDTPHGDFRPWNLILQGHRVEVIDAGHRASLPDEKGLAYTVAAIQL